MKDVGPVVADSDSNRLPIGEFVAAAVAAVAVAVVAAVESIEK